MKLKNNIRLLITCDSGAGSGKTTAAKYLSKKFKLKLLTSGLLYRFVAYKLLKNKKNSHNKIFLKKITKNINLKSVKKKNLYSPSVTQLTAEIAKKGIVRKLLKKYQIKFSKKKLAILEGRDMGILFPKADVKFFFKCSLKIAAKRRFKEFNFTANLWNTRRVLIFINTFKKIFKFKFNLINCLTPRKGARRH